MDPNNLAVNSVTSPCLASSNTGEERFYIALPRLSDGACRDDASDYQHDMKTITLTNFGFILAGIVQASMTSNGGVYEYA